MGEYHWTMICANCHQNLENLLIPGGITRQPKEYCRCRDRYGESEWKHQWNSQHSAMSQYFPMRKDMGKLNSKSYSSQNYPCGATLQLWLICKYMSTHMFGASSHVRRAKESKFNAKRTHFGCFSAIAADILSNISVSGCRDESVEYIITYLHWF